MSFCKVAEKLIKDFLWEGSDNSGVTHIKEKGGLGIDSIMTTKTALFSKWIWRCLTEKNSLRKTFIDAKKCLSITFTLKIPQVCNYGEIKSFIIYKLKRNC